MKSKTLNITTIGLLGAVAIIISAFESTIPPLPMMPPGAKPGFSNIVTMYACVFLGLPAGLTVALVKSLFVGATRGMTAFLMSISGGLLSAAVMGVMFKFKKNPFGLIGVGVGGALSHNLAQLAIAMLLTTPAVLYYTPFLIIYAIITGTTTGLILKLVLPALNKLNLTMGLNHINKKERK